MMYRRYMLIVLSLLIAGCAQVQTPQLGYGVKYEVKVIHVIDGDTIEVQFQDRTETIRILGIDTPEIVAEKNKPYEYKTSNLECLASWGLKAKEFTSMLNGKTVQIEFDEKAGLRDSFGRLLAYVYVDGKDFGKMLVEKGYARVYVEGEFSKRNEYLKAEERAFNSGVGIWSCRIEETPAIQTPTLTPTLQIKGYLSVDSYPSGAQVFVDGVYIGLTPIVRFELNPGSYSLRICKEGYEDYLTSFSINAGEETNLGTLILTQIPIPQIKIYKVNYNAPGDDRYNLNGEYVVIKNYGDAVNLKGWKLRDEYGHTYVFPSVVIPSGGKITIYTGSGIDTQTELYWGRDWPVWNNDGDTAYLYDSSGRLVDSYSWRGYESQPTSPTTSYNNRGLTEEGKRYIAMNFGKKIGNKYCFVSSGLSWITIADGWRIEEYGGTAKIVAILLGGDTVKIKQRIYSYDPETGERSCITVYRTYTYDDLKKANQGYDISIYDVYWIDENDGSNGNQWCFVPNSS